MPLYKVQKAVSIAESALATEDDSRADGLAKGYQENHDIFRSAIYERRASD